MDRPVNEDKVFILDILLCEDRVNINTLKGSRYNEMKLNWSIRAGRSLNDDLICSELLIGRPSVLIHLSAAFGIG